MDEMCMTNVTNIPRRKRSSTFGAYNNTREADRLSQKQNLVMSPLRSVVSGTGSPRLSGRRRSETWHGAVVQTNQVEDKVKASPSCLEESVTKTAPNLKDILHEIITEELWFHLGNDCDLKCSEEFVEKSSIISKAIGEKARQKIDSNTKIVSSVFIGEIRGDGIEVASQCLFDPDQDAFASGNVKTSRIFAVGTLFVASCAPSVSS